jgi:hypothetical protein
MKKIAQLRERWSHRRTVSAPARTCNADNQSMKASTTPISRDSCSDDAPDELDFNDKKGQDEIGYQPIDHSFDDPIVDGLCRRCVGLRLGSSEQQLEVLKVGHMATITKSSIRDGCELCGQFHDIFRALYSPGLRQRKEFGLWCHRLVDTRALQLLVESSANCPQAPRKETPTQSGDIYFIVHAQNPSVHIRLLPTQGTLTGLLSQIAQTVHPDHPDYQFVLTSLDTCRYYHGRNCSHSLPHVHNLRLIDCKSRQIVLAAPRQRYICLSYVWGKGAIQTAVAFDTELPDDVPKTVQDAMFVAINLDIPFLWVDRYCIDQANPKEKHNVIRNMDRIYEGAEITIISATGDDPHYGLPGVRGTPRKPQPTLRVCGKVFMAAQEVAGEILDSKWSTRGWTYQEMLLSRRRLVFTESQMYFQCTMMHGIESLTLGVTHSRGPFGTLYRVFPHRGIGHTNKDLTFRLIEYYKRKLSFQTDTIHAFSGILNAFNDSPYFQNKVTHFYGIPIIYSYKGIDLAITRSFTSNLMWNVHHWDANDHIDNVLYWSRNDAFPSWSWASAKARQGDDTSGQLSQDFQHAEGLPWHHNEVHVQVRHVEENDMDLSTFVAHNDGYERFLPHIDLTSWVLEYDFTRDVTTMFEIIGWSVPPAYRKSKFCVVYVGLQGLVGSTYHAKGIIVREVKPRVFRRVKLWADNVTSFVKNDPAGVEEMLAGVLEAEKKRLHPSLEITGNWHRRTLRII